MGIDIVAALNAKLILFSVIGLALSVYALIVETNLESDANYKAVCDIHQHMSCTKAFSSEYGKGFGLVSPNSMFYKPNSVYGIIHFCIVIGLTLANTDTATKILLFLVALSNISSIYFAYILYFILADFCVICVSIYIVNAILLLYSLSKYAVYKNYPIKVKEN